MFFWIVEFSKEDMAKSLLHMISNDIGQLACLYAKLHNLSRVYFGGFFIRGHPVTMHTITYSINFFTKVSPVLASFLYVKNKDDLSSALCVAHILIPLIFCSCRVKFRLCFWDMKAILEPLEHFSKEQRKIVRTNESGFYSPSCLAYKKKEHLQELIFLHRITAYVLHNLTESCYFVTYCAGISCQHLS